jgi:hypothetical protein
MTTQERIDELKQCPAWETHVSSLEALALQLDSELCREREAHNKTRAELQETEEVSDSWYEAYTEARDDLEATLNENQKFRELLELALPHIHPKAIHVDMSKTNTISEWQSM